MNTEETIPEPGQFKFKCAVQVRFRDLDTMGHVNNAVYFSYFEVARTGYMKALGHCGDESDLYSLYPFMILDLKCRYLSPATLSEELTVHLRTTRVGTKSFEFEYLITAASDGRRVAAGRSTQVYYDYNRRQSLPVPPEFKRRLSALEHERF